LSGWPGNAGKSKQKGVAMGIYRHIMRISRNKPAHQKKVYIMKYSNNRNIKNSYSLRARNTRANRYLAKKRQARQDRAEGIYLLVGSVAIGILFTAMFTISGGAI
jgi:5-hydroxyisourate hydrolase-like protein (transthyretin family)